MTGKESFISGTTYETIVRDFLIRRGIPIEAIQMNGQSDPSHPIKGVDILISSLKLAIEVKGCRKSDDYSYFRFVAKFHPKVNLFALVHGKENPELFFLTKQEIYDLMGRSQLNRGHLNKYLAISPAKVKEKTLLY
jgi:hypothetical protein